MKSLKKALLLMLALALVMTSLFALFSCGEDPCTEHKDENADGKCDVCGAEVEVKTPDEIQLIKDGKATFKVVIASGSSGNVRTKVNQDIVVALKALDIEVEVVDDKADTATEYEVLINGATTRGDTYNVDPHYLGSKGYAVKLVGTKVMIMAGSDKLIDDAIEYFMETVLGITGKTKSLDNVTMTADMNYEEIQSDYAITSVSIAGNNLKDYVIVAETSNNTVSTIATQVQTLIYEKTGLWLKIVKSADSSAKQFIIRLVEEGCKEGFSVTEQNGNLVMECEFENKFTDTALTFIRTEITTKSGDVKLKADYSKTTDVRNIYYKDFGAKGDGRTDDFLALKKAHEYANDYGHTVNADSGSPVYYIGDAMKIYAPQNKDKAPIMIMTDTNWEGASFIFDDSIIPVQYHYEKHQYKHTDGKVYDVLYTDDMVKNNKDAQCSRCLKKIHEDKLGCTNNSSGLHTYSIFVIKSENEEVDLTSTFAGAKINIGDTYLTLADGSKYVPGRPILMQIQDNTKRHYIRAGGNANNGGAQTEIILILADGTIDESTPLHWDYTKVSYAGGKFVDDKPVTVTGGEKGCVITTIANQGPNYYYSYGRNIVVTRSNTTVSGIKHYITGEGLPGKGKCPTSFTNTSFCNNVTYENMLFTHQLDHKDASNKTLLGTYEIGATYSNNLYWKNCDQTNFFEADGSVKGKGFFGTNYCKNFYIYDSLMESFDAHCGTYNVTLVGSTFEHINCVGEGLIYLEDVTVYTDSKRAMICLRGDYGCPWKGDLYAKNVTLRHAQNNSKNTLSVFSGGWQNHIFGFECYMPGKVTLDNVKTEQYNYSNATGKREDRKETIVSTNALPLNLYKALNSFTDVDISDPGAIMPSKDQYLNDLRQCKCSETNPPRYGEPHFNDTDGDGRCNNTIVSEENGGNTTWCWGTEKAPDNTKNINPYHPTEEVYINNCPGLQFHLPPTPQFANTKIYVDGVLQPAGTVSVTVPNKED